MSDKSDILIDVQNVSKKFCRDFKKSLWYGVQDTASDLFRRNKGQASPEADTTNTPNLPHSSFQNSSFPPSLREGEFWANQNISFQVRRGECLGLIGHNGAGKTTLLKMLNGLIKPDTGTITMKGRVAALIALGAGFNPILTGRENIYINGSILGLSRKEIDSKLDEIIDFAEVPEAIDAPVRTYSSGMQVRLGFAVAVVLASPDVLLVDEVFAVGDQGFKHKAHQALTELISGGVAAIFVSHNLHEVGGNTTKCGWLENGTIRTIGPTKDIVSSYLSETGTNSAENVGKFDFSPRRSGLLTITSSSAEVVPKERHLELVIQATFAPDQSIECELVSAITITDNHGSELIRSSCKTSCRIAPPEWNMDIRMELPPMLPGAYTIQFFCWPDGGVMLEGLRNLATFDILPSHCDGLFSKSDQLYRPKMADNARGSIAAVMRQTTKDSSNQQPWSVDA